MVAFKAEMLSKLSIYGLVHGNVSQERADELLAIMRER